MPMLLDIITFLKDAEIVTADGTDAFRDFTPEEPDNIVVLNEYMGDKASLYDNIAHRSVQISCRNTDANAARLKAVSIFTELRDSQSQIGVVTFTASRWGQVFLRQTPFKLKIDGNNRTYYAFNIGITTTIE